MTDYSTWRVIGHGHERTCYQNPDDRTRCVKIIHPSRYKQTAREISYYDYLTSRGVPFDHLPCYYGKIQENGFFGLEQELIQDYDQTGKIKVTEDEDASVSSPTIRQYLEDKVLPPEKVREFWQALEHLKNYLLEYNILALGIDHNNVVVQNTGKNIRMVLIDGVYDTEWIPISKYMPYFGRRKIMRRWNRFMDQLYEKYPQIFIKE